MASRESLKSDLKMLKETFPDVHKRFQISQSATDQLTCRFIAENGREYDIHANIPVRLSNCFFFRLFYRKYCGQSLINVQICYCQHENVHRNNRI